MQKKIFCLFGRWDILSYLMFKSKRQVLNYYSIQKQRFGDWFYPCDRWSVSTWEELFVFLSFSNMTQKVWRSKLNWEKKKDIQLNNSDLKNMPEFYVIESSIKRGDTLQSQGYKQCMYFMKLPHYNNSLAFCYYCLCFSYLLCTTIFKWSCS